MDGKGVLIRQLLLALVGLTLSSGSKRQTDGLHCRECHESKSPSDCYKWALCGEDEDLVSEITYDQLGLGSLCGPRTNAITIALRMTKSQNSVVLTANPWSSITLKFIEQICFTREFMAQDGTKGFHMGCEEKTRCDLYLNAQTLMGLLGKRDSDLDPDAAPDPRQYCYQCCTEDNCNSELCLDSVGVTGGQGHPSSGSHKCPSTFILGKNSCYYIASWTANWYQARTDCERRGADLVSLDSQEEQEFLVKQLQLTNSSTYPRYGYWTGGHYVTAITEWIWLDRTRVSVFTNWGPGQPTSQSYPYNYMISMVNPVVYPTFKGWAWQNYASSTVMGFICERGFL